MNEETKIEAIFRAVESVTGVSKENIRGGCRKREICDARIMTAMLIQQVVIPYHVCKYINRDARMINHYREKFGEFYEFDKEFRKKSFDIVDNLRKNNVYL